MMLIFTIRVMEGEREREKERERKGEKSIKSEQCFSLKLVPVPHSSSSADTSLCKSIPAS